MTEFDVPRVALIGVSGYGGVHFELLMGLWRRGRIRLVACVVINPDDEAEKVAQLRRWHCPVYASAEQMFLELNQLIDLCVIPTPVALHVPMTLAALAAGANVLVEKPLAASLDDVESVRAAERASGRFVAVGFQDLFVEDNLILKRALLDRAIGRLMEIRVIGMWPRPLSYYRRNDWAGAIKRGDDLFLDSPISNAFAHFLNLALFMAGAEFATSAQTTEVESELFRVQPIQNFCTAAVRIRTKENVTICAYFSHSCERELAPRLMILGECGRVEWYYLDHFIVRPHVGEVWQNALPDLTGLRETVYARILEKLVDRSIFTCGVEIATEHVRCFNLIQRASGIRQLAPPWKKEQGAADTTNLQIVIPGIEEAMLTAFNGGSLLQETNSPLVSMSSSCSEPGKIPPPNDVDRDSRRH